MRICCRCRKRKFIRCQLRLSILSDAVLSNAKSMWKSLIVIFRYPLVRWQKKGSTRLLVTPESIGWTYVFCLHCMSFIMWQHHATNCNQNYLLHIWRREYEKRYYACASTGEDFVSIFLAFIREKTGIKFIFRSINVQHKFKQCSEIDREWRTVDIEREREEK